MTGNSPPGTGSKPEAGAAGLLYWIVPSLGSLIAVLALLNGLFLSSHRLFSGDGDVGRHLRVGRTILESGKIPRVDLFSHTRLGTPFIPYEWFSEASTAAVDQIFGLAGVAVVAAILYCIATVCVYRSAELLGSRRPVAALVAVLAMIMQLIHYLPRPHLLTTALAGIFLLLLLRFTRSGSAWELVPLPFLTILWANSHGGFLIGFILMFAFTLAAILGSTEFRRVAAARKVLPLLLLLCFGASLLNPVGIELWRHTTGYLEIDFLVAATDEYRSVDFQEGGGKFFFVLLFAGPALWMTGKVRVTILAAGLYFFFAAAALHSARNIPLFTVVVLPWLAPWLEQWMSAARDARPKWYGPIIGHLDKVHATDMLLRPGLSSIAIAAALVLALGPLSARYDWSPDVFPVEAMGVLSGAQVSGPVFNLMIWGGYMLDQRPDIPVFIDGQTDFYGEALTREYLVVLAAEPGWNDVLRKYDVQWTITPHWIPLTSVLALDPHWEPEYEDDLAIVYRRLVE